MSIFLSEYHLDEVEGRGGVEEEISNLLKKDFEVKDWRKLEGLDIGVIRSVSWTADGRRLAAVCDKGAVVWEEGTGWRELKGLDVGVIWYVSWTADGRRLAA